jgi:hypothetical protein
MLFSAFPIAVGRSMPRRADFCLPDGSAGFNISHNMAEIGQMNAREKKA